MEPVKRALSIESLCIKLTTEDGNLQRVFTLEYAGVDFKKNALETGAALIFRQLSTSFNIAE